MIGIFAGFTQSIFTFHNADLAAIAERARVYLEHVDSMNFRNAAL